MLHKFKGSLIAVSLLIVVSLLCVLVICHLPFSVVRVIVFKLKLNFDKLLLAQPICDFAFVPDVFVVSR